MSDENEFKPVQPPSYPSTPRVSSTPRTRLSGLLTPSQPNYLNKNSNASVSSIHNKSTNVPIPKVAKVHRALYDTSKYRDLAQERRDNERTGNFDQLDESATTGLDFELLERRRKEIEEEKRIQELNSENLEVNSGPSSLAIKQLVFDQHGQTCTIELLQNFATDIGQSIYNALFKTEIPTQNNFLPGKTSFIFNLGLETVDEIPIIQYNSVSVDFQKNLDYQYEISSSNFNPDLIKRLSIALSNIEKNTNRKKLNEVEKKLKIKNLVKEVFEQKQRQAEEEKQCLDEEIDIFGDFEPVKDEGLKSHESNVDSEVKMTSNHPLKTITNQSDLWRLVLSEKKNFDSSQERNDCELSNKVSYNNKKALASLMVEEEYDGRNDDSDEDEDLDLQKMDMKVKLKRADFKTDREWESYEANREIIPKAAYRFGQKNSDVRHEKKDKKRIYKELQKKVTGSVAYQKD